jgi:hypothetical protein
VNADPFPPGSRWTLPDGRRVQVIRQTGWGNCAVVVVVENPGKGGRRTTSFMSETFARIATPREDPS